MFYVCVFFALCHGVSWGGLDHLLLACGSHGNSLKLSDIEMGEVIREPARIEDERLVRSSLALAGVSMYKC